jgi:capsular exopolysaccharide synthesis family protein
MARRIGDESSPRGGTDAPIRSVRPSYAESGPDLREALSVVWLRKWSIVAITLLMVGVALLVSSRQSPVYESQVRLLVVPLTGAGPDSIPLPDLNLETEAELINSVAVAEIVAEDLDFSGPPRNLLGNLGVDRPTDTEILVVNYRHADPLQAQRVASSFADAYIEFRTETVTQAVLSSAENIQDQLAELTSDFNAVIRQLQGLPDDDPNRALLEARATLLSAQIVPLQLELVSLPDEVTVGRIIQPAAFPSTPVSPNHVVNGVFGLIAGLGLGIGLAFLRDRLSERLRSSEEAEAYLEAPILAAIPRVASWRRRKEPFLVAAVQWRSPAAEGYRVLRTNVLSAAAALGVKTVAITSAHAGEGKSATVANLGVVLARAGKTVSIVSADLRRPRLHEFFKREGQPGLIEVLAGRATLADTLQTVTLPTRGFDTDSASLRLLPSGRVPEDPTELITSEKMSKVIRDLEAVSDIVLIDLPPVLPITDALVVAAVTKHVLLVIGPKADTRPVITSARQQLDRVGARILGGVLNGPHPSLGQSYYSY